MEDLIFLTLKNFYVISRFFQLSIKLTKIEVINGLKKKRFKVEKEKFFKTILKHNFFQQFLFQLMIYI